jgi:hypothetical protein
MFRGYLRSFLATPQRLWDWAEHHPYESIGYGAVLLFLALAAKAIIVAAAGVAIAGGIYWMFNGPR